MHLADLTWPEYRDRIAHLPLVLPIGAIEPHGPHLPLGTDVLVAEHLAERLTERMPVLVAPTLSFGYRTNPVRLGGEFPGTLDLRAETFRDHVGDLLAAAHRDGARRFFILHTAYANVPFAHDAVAGFVDRHDDVRVLAASWWDFAPEPTRNAIAAQTGVERADDHHAALVETSLVMHMFPDRVRDDLIADDAVARRARYSVLPLPADFRTGSGVVYRASGATPEIGKQLTAEIVDNMVAAVALELDTPASGRFS